MKTLNFSIISPEKELYRGLITEVLTESNNGFIQILPDHMDVIVVLKPSITSFKQEDGKELKAFTSDGIMTVKNNLVSILCDSCEWPENIDLMRAEEAKRRAEDRLKTDSNIDKLRAEIALKKAMARIKVKSK